MVENILQKFFDFIGIIGDDMIVNGFMNDEGQMFNEQLDVVDKVNGYVGDDVICMGEGLDLVVGDMVGQEWVFVDGKWVYNLVLQVNLDLGVMWFYDDNI